MISMKQLWDHRNCKDAANEYLPPFLGGRADEIFLFRNSSAQRDEKTKKPIIRRLAAQSPKVLKIRQIVEGTKLDANFFKCHETASPMTVNGYTVLPRMQNVANSEVNEIFNYRKVPLDLGYKSDWKDNKRLDFKDKYVQKCRSKVLPDLGYKKDGMNDCRKRFDYKNNKYVQENNKPIYMNCTNVQEPHISNFNNDWNPIYNLMDTNPNSSMKNIVESPWLCDRDNTLWWLRFDGEAIQAWLLNAWNWLKVRLTVVLLAKID